MHCVIFQKNCVLSGFEKCKLAWVFFMQLQYAQLNWRYISLWAPCLARRWHDHKDICIYYTL